MPLFRSKFFSRSSIAVDKIPLGLAQSGSPILAQLALLECTLQNTNMMLALTCAVVVAKEPPMMRLL